MDPAIERYHEVKQAFLQVVELPVAERQAALERATNSCPELRPVVQKLLSLHDRRPEAAAEEEDLMLEAWRDEALSRYTHKRVLGVGGSGVVHEAVQDQPRRTVAVKFLRRQRDASQRRRFLQEIEILGRLAHPGIAQIIEGGETTTGVPFFVMDFVDGRPITHFAKEHALPLQARLDLFLQLCRAVEHAHGSGVVHRDLKPGNVLVDGTGRVRVLDFGIARLVGQDGNAGMRTHTGHWVGTPAYMAPEQAGLSDAEVGPAADIFALGRILAELVSGRRDAKAELPAPLAAVVAKATDPEPQLRHASVAALAEAVAVGQRNRMGGISFAHRVLVPSALVIVLLTSLASTDPSQAAEFDADAPSTASMAATVGTMAPPPRVVERRPEPRDIPVAKRDREIRNQTLLTAAIHKARTSGQLEDLEVQVRAGWQAARGENPRSPRAWSFQNDLAEIAFAVGKYEEAEALARDFLAQGIPVKVLEVRASTTLSQIMLRRAKYPEAVRLARQAERILRGGEHRNPPLLGVALFVQAACAAASGERSGALVLASEAEQILTVTRPADESLMQELRTLIANLKD